MLSYGWNQFCQPQSTPGLFGTRLRLLQSFARSRSLIRQEKPPSLNYGKVYHEELAGGQDYELAVYWWRRWTQNNMSEENIRRRADHLSLRTRQDLRCAQAFSDSFDNQAMQPDATANEFKRFLLHRTRYSKVYRFRKFSAHWPNLSVNLFLRRRCWSARRRKCTQGR